MVSLQWRLLLGCLAIALWPGSGIGLAQQWNEFRGPGGTGVASATNLPIQWDASKNVVWKTAVPGRGWSSPVVGGDQVWLTSAVETELNPAEREERMKSARIPGLVPVKSIDLFAFCFDAKTGELRAELKLGETSDPPLIHNLNSFSSPTPVLDENSAYCSFGAFGTWCIDRETEQIKWVNRELQLDHETGPGSSPILWRDLLIFHCDGIDNQFVVALERQTGKVVWKTARSGKLNENDSLKKAFSTPIVVSIDGAEQLVSAGANWLYGYQPDTGVELWKMPYGKLGFSNVPRPVYQDGMLYLCTGYNRSSLLAIRLADPAGPTEDDVVWRYETQVPTMPTPLLTDGLLLMVSDRGIATCLDAKSGEQHWRERLGGDFASSPILADGKVFVGNRKGEMFVIRPGTEFELLATNQMDGDIMATPAAVAKQLLIRTKNSLYSIQKQ